MSTPDVKSIVFVKNTSLTKYYNLKLSSELSIDIKTVSTIQNVFPLLSDPSFNPTAISVEINDYIDNDLFDIMHSLSTIIKCTLCRIGPSTIKRRTVLVALVNSETPKSIIKSLLLMPSVDHVGLSLSNSNMYDDIKDDTDNYINGIFRTNKKVKQMVYSKVATVREKVHQIELTPRQAQIVQLVKTRGVSNKVIARMLNLSESTIKLHLGIIFRKYGVKNRTQLAVSANEIE